MGHYQYRGMDIVEIWVKGVVQQGWSRIFADVVVANTLQGTSVLIGSIRDQSELRGILNHLADLGLELICVHTLPTHRGGDADKKC